MKNLLISWLFFASLSLLLLICAVVLPEILDTIFGNTDTVALELESDIRAVWANLHP